MDARCALRANRNAWIASWRRYAMRLTRRGPRWRFIITRHRDCTLNVSQQVGACIQLCIDAAVPLRTVIPRAAAKRAVGKIKIIKFHSTLWLREDDSGFGVDSLNQLSRELLRILSLQLQPHSGTRQIGNKGSVHRLRSALEEHLLDTRVIMEVLDMAELRQRTGWMAMDRGRRVCRKGNMKALSQRACPQESADAFATRGVGLQDVNCLRFEHVAEVVLIVPVFPGGYFHAGRSAVANQSQTFEVV